MIKKISSGLIVFAGIVSLPGAVSQKQAQQQPAADYRNDPRLGCLQRFFGHAGCPVVKLANIFLEAADDYHLDWRLLPSLSFVETGGGKAASNNNLFGWACGRAHFDSSAAGIHQVGFQLAHKPAYRHKNVAQILAVYNPSPEYARKVVSVMRQIAPTE
jgi:hypothetical protein